MDPRLKHSGVTVLRLASSSRNFQTRSRRTKDSDILDYKASCSSCPSERQDKPGRSNILKGGYLVDCPFDK
jgi:hypothetical protein